MSCASWAEGSDSAPPPKRRRLAPGTLVDGRYEVGDVLGVGGLAVVYGARHRYLDRPVALKVLTDASARSALAVRRFEREGRVGGTLNHPNIARIFDAGVCQGRRYIAQERLNGASALARLRARGAQPVGPVISTVAGVLAAVTHAHQLGIVHRDLKLEHVFHQPTGAETTGANRGAQEIAKVVDFGVSLADDLRDGERITAQGDAVGTPSYMAPEVILGSQADHRVDVYSVGVIAYWLLAGRPPFQAQTVAGLFEAIVNHSPAPIRDTRSDVSQSLEQVIFRALAKDPEARWRSAADMSDALRFVLPIGGADASHRVDVADDFGSSTLQGLGADETRTPQA